jgi:hypothetical protein
MELVGLLLIILAFIILANRINQNEFKFLYLSIAFLLIIVSTRIILRFNSVEYLNWIYIMLLFIMVIWLLFGFYDLLKTIITNLVRTLRSRG